MRIVCPACAAAYEVPDGRLLPGRVVRCARCETDWMPLGEVEPEPPSPELDAVPPPEPEIEAPVVEAPVVEAPGVEALVIETPVAPAPVEVKQVVALRASWAASVLLLLAGFYLAYSARERVMHAWPPSMRAYAALGLTRH